MKVLKRVKKRKLLKRKKGSKIVVIQNYVKNKIINDMNNNTNIIIIIK